MRRCLSVSLWQMACVVCSLCVLQACRHTEPPPPPLVPQTSGSIAVPGLSAPVRVVRDTWGVPHIYASTVADLFTAQGFVQAQDRLFQMDLWRRSSQGKLAQVLGPNFVERDAMTRQVQFQGPLDDEWASYGADARAIAEAFVRGINAWVARARERPPEEFVLAKWKPEFWAAADVLNRTDAFVASGDALAEIRRRGWSDVVADSIRRVGTAPFFATSLTIDPAQAAVRATTNAYAEPGSLVGTEASPRLTVPSPRYFVHLKGPGWNVVGATSPWLPGVAFGHNERVAWALAPAALDTQDVYSEPDDGPRTIAIEAIAVKGRLHPFLFHRVATPHGIVVASDRERHTVFTVRWSGLETGGAAELAALLVDRAADWPSFRDALSHWKMPARQVLFADVEGNTGFQDAALVPNRVRGEWRGWLGLDQLPHAFNRPLPKASAPGRGSTEVADTAIFAHVLGTTAAARSRFDVGPVPRGNSDAPVRIAIDVGDWDRSSAMNAPGQSGAPASAHFKDLAPMWTDGRSFPLAFTDAAVEANANATLVLVPR